MLQELLCEKCTIDDTLYDKGGDTMKLGGAVETAAYTLSMALDILAVRWPHRRGSLMRARKISDQARMLALGAAPFGSHVGPAEAAGYAQLAAARGKRSTVELPTPRLPTSQTRNAR